MNRVYKSITEFFKKDRENESEPLNIYREYNLNHVDAFSSLDEDSKGASQAVMELGLNYSIDTYHKATFVEGELENKVNVEWQFWE
jgi:hypothetical protein